MRNRRPDAIGQRLSGEHGVDLTDEDVREITAAVDAARSRHYDSNPVVEAGLTERLHAALDEVAALRAELAEAMDRKHAAWLRQVRAEAERDRCKTQADEIHAAYKLLATERDEMRVAIETCSGSCGFALRAAQQETTDV